MADLLNIGTSGLMAYQNVLNTISHNITNASTEGYSRQSAELVTRPPQGAGFGFIGSGVRIASIERTVDEFLIGQVRTQTSYDSELRSFHDLASRIDNLLSDPDAGVSPMIQQFFDSVQGVADTPGLIPSRQVMLTNASSIVERLHYMYQNMDSLNDAIRTDVGNTVAEINQLAASIADLNDQIVRQTQQFGQSPNDLLDQRDELLRQLSERVGVTTVTESDGTMNVFIGSGQTLVIGKQHWDLQQANGEYDPREYELFLSSGGAGVNVTNAITGGRLGGILDFREEILEPALNQLGRIAISLSASFNEQHKQGLTLNDELGDNFFTDFTAPGAVDVLARLSNTGSGAMSVDIVDASKLTADEYLIRYDGGNNYTLLRSPEDTVATTFSGAVPFSAFSPDFEGIQINVTAVPNVGDTFMIRPTRTAARELQVLVDDVNDIAAAGAVRGVASYTNVGDATISAGTLIIDPTDPDYVLPAVFNTGTPVTIDFRTSGAGTAPYADEYSLDGGGTWQAYTSGADISLNGMRVQISGTPFDGDSFTMERNTGGESDNRNALLLAQLQTADTMGDQGAGATMDFQSAYGQLVALIGTKTHQADVASQSQGVILQQTVAARDQVSGVNLDEEAANLIKMQQAYQAAAKVITTAQSIFQTLLDSVR